MVAESLSADLVGTKFESQTVSWDKKDQMLYALGVGCKPATDLQFVYEGVNGRTGPVVLPTYSVIPGMRAMGNISQAVKLKVSRLLHGEQAIEIFRPIPPKAEVKMDSYISEVWDKGKAGVIGVKAEFYDDDGPLFSTHSTLFYLGGGGFGGDPGPSTKEKNIPPSRDPDAVVEYTTQEEQGAIYRLSGDMVALHIDPEFAQKAGYEKPFMHGLCTYGFVGRAVIQGLCGGDAAKLKFMEGRFAERVEFCDQVITKMWKTGDGEAIIQAETQDGKVALSQARVLFEE